MEIKELSQSFIDLLHDQAIEINNIYDDIGSIFDAYGKDTPSDSELKRLYDECDRIYAVCDTIIQNSIRAIEREQKKHGGVRQGAGRKKSAPTKQVRVPEDLVHVVSALVEAYKSGRWDSEYRTRVSRYINETDMAMLVNDAKIDRVRRTKKPRRDKRT